MWLYGVLSGNFILCAVVLFAAAVFSHRKLSEKVLGFGVGLFFLAVGLTELLYATAAISRAGAIGLMLTSLALFFVFAVCFMIRFVLRTGPAQHGAPGAD